MLSNPWLRIQTQEERQVFEIHLQHQIFCTSILVVALRTATVAYHSYQILKLGMNVEGYASVNASAVLV